MNEGTSGGQVTPTKRSQLMLVDGVRVAPSAPDQTSGIEIRPAAADAARNPTNILGGRRFWIS